MGRGRLGENLPSWPHGHAWQSWKETERGPGILGILGILFWVFLLRVGVIRLELGVSGVFLWLFAGMLR